MVLEGDLELVIRGEPLTLQAVIQVLLHDGGGNVDDGSLSSQVLEAQVRLAPQQLLDNLVVAELCCDVQGCVV